MAEVYKGRRFPAELADHAFLPHCLEVLADGAPLDPGPSQKVRNHSPDGFNWGYGGSGPAQLALALLLDVTGSAEASQRYYQSFKAQIVAGWGDRWTFSRNDILDWLHFQSGYSL